MSRKTRGLLLHGLIFCAVGVVAWLGCPVYTLLGICCPLCGTTRAWVNALHGAFGEAFRCHPMFLITPFWFWGAVHYDALLKKNRLVFWLLLVVAAALFGMNVLRWLGVLPLPS